MIFKGKRKCGGTTSIVVYIDVVDNIIWVWGYFKYS